MSPSHHQPYSVPFWDFVQAFDPSQGPGRGVDHSNSSSHFPFMAGYPFGGPGGPGPHGPAGARGPPPPPPEADGFVWGPWYQGAGPWDRPRGHHEHHRSEGESSAADAERDANNTANNEKSESPETMTADAPDPEEVVPDENQCGRRPQGFGRGRGRGGPRGGRCGRGGRGGFPHHGPHHPPPPYPGQGGPFDLSGLFRGWAGHPFFRNLREQAQRFQEGQSRSDDDANNSTFTPPVDVFNTERAYVLHVALPGARKEDVGVDWDADRSLLRIAGVVHRPGDEAFLGTLATGERKVGVFERSVALPPEGVEERDEIDSPGITAKMQDGVLVITVPKVEREWTEIRKVDIE